jgi:hypothetical protein
LSETPQEKKDGAKKADCLVLIIPFDPNSDPLILSLDEYERFKRLPDITKANRKRGKDDL